MGNNDLNPRGLKSSTRPTYRDTETSYLLKSPANSAHLDKSLEQLRRVR